MIDRYQKSDAAKSEMGDVIAEGDEDVGFELIVDNMEDFISELRYEYSDSIAPEVYSTLHTHYGSAEVINQLVKEIVPGYLEPKEIQITSRVFLIAAANDIPMYTKVKDHERQYITNVVEAWHYVVNCLRKRDESGFTGYRETINLVTLPTSSPSFQFLSLFINLFTEENEFSDVEVTFISKKNIDKLFDIIEEGRRISKSVIKEIREQCARSSAAYSYNKEILALYETRNIKRVTELPTIKVDDEFIIMKYIKTAKYDKKGTLVRDIIAKRINRIYNLPRDEELTGQDVSTNKEFAFEIITLGRFLYIANLDYILLFLEDIIVKSESMSDADVLWYITFLELVVPPGIDLRAYMRSSATNMVAYDGVITPFTKVTYENNTNLDKWTAQATDLEIYEATGIVNIANNRFGYRNLVRNVFFPYPTEMTFAVVYLKRNFRKDTIDVHTMKWGIYENDADVGDMEKYVIKVDKMKRKLDDNATTKFVEAIRSFCFNTISKAMKPQEDDMSVEAEFYRDNEKQFLKIEKLMNKAEDAYIEASRKKIRKALIQHSFSEHVDVILGRILPTLYF